MPRCAMMLEGGGSRMADGRLLLEAIVLNFSAMQRSACWSVEFQPSCVQLSKEQTRPGRICKHKSIMEKIVSYTKFYRISHGSTKSIIISYKSEKISQ